MTPTRTAKGGVGWGVSSGVKTSNRFGVLDKEVRLSPTGDVKTKSAVLIGESNVNRYCRFVVPQGKQEG